MLTCHGVDDDSAEQIGEIRPGHTAVNAEHTSVDLIDAVHFGRVRRSLLLAWPVKSSEAE